MIFKKIFLCILILFQTQTIPSKNWIWLLVSILLTVIFHPKSIFQRKTEESKKHFLSDYLPKPIVVKTTNGIFFIARPKFEDLARFLFSKIMAKWEPISIIKLNESDVIIDVGANVGYYTLQLSQYLGNTGKIISIEPDPETCDTLKKNCQLNNLKNIIIHNCAISSKTGVITLYKSETHSGESSIYSTSIENKKSSISIPSYSLDDLLNTKYSKIDFIKIDVEGAELDVLKGGTKTLKITKKILIELHEDLLKKNKQNSEMILNLLKNNDFKIKLFTENWSAMNSRNFELKSDYILAEKEI